MKGETEDTKYRCIGAVEVQLHMHELGHSEDELPSMSTIKRIIKRNGLRNPLLVVAICSFLQNELFL